MVTPVLSPYSGFWGAKSDARYNCGQYEICLANRNEPETHFHDDLIFNLARMMEYRLFIQFISSYLNTGKMQ